LNAASPVMMKMPRMCELISVVNSITFFWKSTRPTKSRRRNRMASVPDLGAQRAHQDDLVGTRELMKIPTSSFATPSLRS
jgi:hypothetical protein